MVYALFVKMGHAISVYEWKFAGFAYHEEQVTEFEESCEQDDVRSFWVELPE